MWQRRDSPCGHPRRVDFPFFLLPGWSVLPPGPPASSHCLYVSAAAKGGVNWGRSHKNGCVDNHSSYKVQGTALARDQSKATGLPRWNEKWSSKAESVHGMHSAVLCSTAVISSALVYNRKQYYPSSRKWSQKYLAGLPGFNERRARKRAREGILGHARNLGLRSTDSEDERGDDKWAGPTLNCPQLAIANTRLL